MKKLLATTTVAALAFAGAASAETMATAATDLNLRSAPQSTASVVTVIANGDEVSVAGCIESANWCEVTYKDQKGWAYGDYLTTKVGDKVEVICDGGVTRGTHVLKALAAGARACSGGRLYLYALAAAGEGLDRAVGDLLPAAALVAGRCAGAHGEAAVEQHDALLCPRCEVAVAGGGDAEVVDELAVDVEQGPGQRPHVRRHREGESDGVAGGGVGVLADDEHPDLVERDGEGSQHVLASGKVAVAGGDLGAQVLAHGRDRPGDGLEGLRPRGVDELGQGLCWHPPNLCLPRGRRTPRCRGPGGSWIGGRQQVALVGGTGAPASSCNSILTACSTSGARNSGCWLVGSMRSRALATMASMRSQATWG